MSVMNENKLSSRSKGAALAAAYSLTFWAVMIPCDMLANLCGELKWLMYLSFVLPILLVIIYTPLEIKLSEGETADFNIGFFAASVIIAVVCGVLLSTLIVPLIVMLYHSKVDYGGDMFSGLAYNLEGIQFALYFLLYIAGGSAALLVRGIVYLVQCYRKKNMY